MDTKKTIIRHGELLLIPVLEMPEGNPSKVKNYTAAHSETGHNHVLEGDIMVIEREGKDVFIELEEDTDLVHKKSFDNHNTLTVPKGIYRLLKKKEYDPFEKAMRQVWD